MSANPLVPATLTNLTLGTMSERLDLLTDLVQENAYASADTFDGTVGYALDFFSKMQSLSVLAEACLLYNVKYLWDIGGINVEVTTRYDGDFLRWATEALRRGSIEMKDSTIKQKIEIYRYYFSREKDTFSPMATVAIYHDGQLMPEEVPVDMTTVAFNKLEAAKGTARQNGNKLSEELLIAMMDDTTTTRDFRSLLAREKASIQGKQLEAGEEPEETMRGKVKRTKKEIEDGVTIEEKRAEVEEGFDEQLPEPMERPAQLSNDEFWAEGGIVYYTSKEHNKTFTLGHFEPEATRDPIAYKAVAYMLNAIGLKTDTLENQPMESFTAPRFGITEEGTFLVNLDGTTLNEYDISELDNMIMELSDLRDAQEDSDY